MRIAHKEIYDRISISVPISVSLLRRVGVNIIFPPERKDFFRSDLIISEAKIKYELPSESIAKPEDAVASR